MADSFTVTTVALTFLLAGGVKGVIGLGLPTVALALLTVTVGLQSAMALLLLPSLATNLWQACAGGAARSTVRRIWPFLLAATVTVGIGSLALARADISILSALLGVLISVYALANLASFTVAIPRAREKWAGPLAGAANGVLTGMTGSFVVPGVLYLQAIGLPRDMFIQAMGMLFTVSTIALAFALRQQHYLTPDLLLLSAAAVLPAILGMMAGTRFRKKISEANFKRAFFYALLLLGLYIVFRASTS